MAKTSRALGVGPGQTRSETITKPGLRRKQVAASPAKAEDQARAEAEMAAAEEPQSG
jgi:hypothetical protein